jgi:hypothetical protein
LGTSGSIGNRAQDGMSKEDTSDDEHEQTD